MSYPYILQGHAVTIIIDGKPHTVTQEQLGFDAIIKGIREGDWDAVRAAITPAAIINKLSLGAVTVENGEVRWRGRVVHNALTQRMIEMIDAGFNIDPLVQFMTRLMANPSARAVNELYSFLERCNLPITPDGYFLAFRRVRGDYFDCHSGTVPNHPAEKMTPALLEQGKVCGKRQEVTVTVVDGETVVSMERNQVDDFAKNVCSDGLHFCSLEYLNTFEAPVTLIVRIDPADVVSIPVDYNFAKGRTCRYTVVSELTGSVNTAFTKPVAENAEGATPLTRTSRNSDCDNADWEDDDEDEFEDYDDEFEDYDDDNNSSMEDDVCPVAPCRAKPHVTPKSGGRELSMTKDAIRKREARARARAARGG